MKENNLTMQRLLRLAARRGIGVDVLCFKNKIYEGLYLQAAGQIIITLCHEGPEDKQAETLAKALAFYVRYRRQHLDIASTLVIFGEAQCSSPYETVARESVERLSTRLLKYIKHTGFNNTFSHAI